MEVRLPWPELIMSFPFKLWIPLGVVAAVSSGALAQNSSPTPRELFYHPDPSQDVTHKTGAKGSKRSGKTGGTSQGSGGSGELAGGGHIVKVSMQDPLGITYTLRKAVGDSMVDVSPDATFHTDDRIDFVVQSNYAGYLYIGSKDSSGSWTPLFPSSEIANGNNHVEAYRRYTMPPGVRKIKFYEPTGMEEVFILFSKEPVADFEKLLHGEKPNGPAAKPLQMAKVELPGSMVDRLRNTSSRDLRIEKIDEDGPGDHKEKAVYVVNRSGKSDSQVWADLKLVHK